ncbi:mobilization protein A [Mariprofundus micogutta]|uniref:Mobilization protein A n=1 Tax=Mariprofundus micogutta TaxID=1921010 RepID=A0A1L8CKA1_9PROT|nr:DNA-primase RepB domain-containing protein [Mariprofundus micogutta]GAV19305.1 mobilization protein A [Mariprofundus micogutta]
MNRNIKQQIGFFIQPEIGITSFDLAARGAGKMILREDVQAGDIDRYLKWLGAENAKGSEIQVRPHRHDSNAVIFLDDVERGQALAISRKYSACVIETSKEGGCHIWLQTDRPLNERERYLAQRHIQPLINSDRGSISGEHFGRLAGFKNHKRAGQWVNVISVSSAGAWTVPREALIDCEPSVSNQPFSPPSGVCVVNNSSTGGSESENEWGYVCGRLEHGADPILLERELVERATGRGKRNAVSYAHRTIKRALSHVTRHDQI